MAEESNVQNAPAETPASAAAPAPESRTAPPLPEGKLWIWGLGRRKKAIARVRIRPGKGQFMVNDREVDEFFRRETERNTVRSPLAIIRMVGSWDVFVKVQGGGPTGQAGALALGLARALVQAVPDDERTLRDQGLLTRDARMKERKKYGQKGARRRFQFSKR